MHVTPNSSDMTDRLATVGQKMLSVALRSGDPQSPVNQAVGHHLGTLGLCVRSQIALHAAVSLNVDAQSALAMATCCELLHNASLIHDDLQDRDHLRRGEKAVWALFYDDVAVCAGDLLLSSAYAVLAEVTDVAAIPRLIAQTHAAVAQTIHGQASFASPPQADFDRLAAYQAMAAAKSGPLLGLPFGLIFNDCNQPNLIELSTRAVHAFSIAYQIADDLEDLDADARTPLGVAANIVIVLEIMGCTHRVAARSSAVQLPSLNWQRHWHSLMTCPRGLPRSCVSLWHALTINGLDIHNATRSKSRGGCHRNCCGRRVRWVGCGVAIARAAITSRS